MKAGAIILAAGESRRMGRPKAFLPFRDGTFLSVLGRALGRVCDPVIAVFGFDGEHLAARADPAVTAVINHDYAHGMLTSLQTGLRSLPGDLETVLFTLVDHPAIGEGTIEALLCTGADIAIPRFQGRRGHPVLISRKIAREFLAEPFTSKVHDVINRYADEIRYVDVDDPEVLQDIDDEGLYGDLLAREAALLR